MTTPCTQGPLMEVIVGKIDRVADDVRTIQGSVHNIDLRVTQIEILQLTQEKYVESKSKRNGQFYGSIWGAFLSLIVGGALQVIIFYAKMKSDN